MSFVDEEDVGKARWLNFWFTIIGTKYLRRKWLYCKVKKPVIKVKVL